MYQIEITLKSNQKITLESISSETLNVLKQEIKRERREPLDSLVSLKDAATGNKTYFSAKCVSLFEIAKIKGKNNGK